MRQSIPNRCLGPVTGIRLALAALMLVAAASSRDSTSLWRHLSNGMVVARDGPAERDSMTVLGANRPWANLNWLSDLSIYLIYLAGGIAGIVLAKIVVASLIALPLVHPIANRWDWLLAFPLPFAVFALRDQLNLPGAIGLLCFALVVIELGPWQVGRRWPAVIRLILWHVFWVNVEPHFLFGPLCIALCLVGAMIDRWNMGYASPAPLKGIGYLAVSLGMAGIATLANPSFWRAWPAGVKHCFAAFTLAPEGQWMVAGLTPIWSQASLDAATFAFIALACGACGVALWPAIRFRWILPTFAMVLVGICDRRLFAFSAVWCVHVIQAAVWCGIRNTQEDFAPVSVDEKENAERSGRRMARPVVLGLFGAAAIVGVFQWLNEFPYLRRHWSAGTVEQSRMSWLAESGLSGSVLPLAPADGGWLAFGNSQVRPYLDDRIELFFNVYGTYYRLCRDVVEDRHNTYRRADGTLGGWRPVHNMAAFDWIVSRADAVSDNRLLAASARWGPIYWDPEVVVYGKEQDARVQRASRRLSELEVRAADSAAIHEERELAAAWSTSQIATAAWEEYSPHETVSLAKVMIALDCPNLAIVLLDRVHDPTLRSERDHWMRECTQMRSRLEPFTFQEHSREIIDH